MRTNDCKLVNTSTLGGGQHFLAVKRDDKVLIARTRRAVALHCSKPARGGNRPRSLHGERRLRTPQSRDTLEVRHRQWDSSRRADVPHAEVTNAKRFATSASEKRANTCRPWLCQSGTMGTFWSFHPGCSSPCPWTASFPTPWVVELLLDHASQPAKQKRTCWRVGTGSHIHTSTHTHTTCNMPSWHLLQAQLVACVPQR